MASQEQRVRYLLPQKGRKEKRCLIEAAFAFARSRDKWLTIEELHNLMKGSGKEYCRSALYDAVGGLSSPMATLNGCSYIDKDISNVRPMKYKLSSAASRKIFDLVTPDKVPSKPHLRSLKGRGRIKILPLNVENEHEIGVLKNKEIVSLAPKNIMNLVEQKIGVLDTNRLLKSLTSNQGIEYGKFAVRSESITKTHRWGRQPSQQYELTNAGLRRLFGDQNELWYRMDTHIADTRHDDARVRALEERAGNGEQSAFDELIQVLSSDASKYARQSAAHSLGRLGDNRAIEPLIEAMLSDEYGGVRSVAVEKLEPFGYRQEFASALKDSDPHIRREAANILGRIKDARAIEPLREALDDPDVGVRCETICALGEIGDPKAFDFLIPLTESENESIRNAADKALRNIEDLRSRKRQ